MAKAENTIIFFKFPFGYLLFSARFARAPRKFAYTARAVRAEKKEVLKILNRTRKAANRQTEQKNFVCIK